MKLIFREYLSSLRERGELDVIMPDLLSELRMNVLSRPGIGTRQFGVDVAAVGEDDGTRRMFLLSVKPGDLTRSDWSSGPQCLRASLDDILDVYVENHIPKRYAHCPIVVVLCIGGDVVESVRPSVEGYMTRHATDRIRFELWNGDRLSELLLSGVLREKALPDTWHSDLRKSLAMIDEPQASFDYFCRLLTNVAAQCKPSRAARLTAVRRIYIALWTLYAWSRGDGNIESAFLCSERSALVCWELVKSQLSGKSKPARALRDSIERLIALHQAIASDYIATNIGPRAETRHGLASAVPSQEYLDINLRLFDALGRVGMHGLWLFHRYQHLQGDSEKDAREAIRQDLSNTASLIVDVIGHNPTLRTPIKDNQAIDIDIVCLFLNRMKCDDFIRKWIANIVGATIFAFRTNGPYPCIHNDYRNLLEHPKDKGDYRIEATAGSVLLPTLAAWAAFTGDTDTVTTLADFSKSDYSHSTLQMLVPGSDTETRLYQGATMHGLNVNGFAIPDTCEDMISLIRTEVAKASPDFESLSALVHGLWPLLVLASRHHRFPVPPHLWPIT